MVEYCNINTSFLHTLNKLNMFFCFVSITIFKLNIFQDMTPIELKAGIESKIFRTQSRICKEKNGHVAKKLKSDIWNVFHEIVHIESSKVVEYSFFCSKCNTVVTNKKKNVQITPSMNKSEISNGNTPLLRHICAQLQGGTQSNSTITRYMNSSKVFKFNDTDKEAIKTSFSSFVSIDMRPFSAVENVGFRNVCKTMFDLGQKYAHQNVLQENFDNLLLKRTAVSLSTLNNNFNDIIWMNHFNHFILIHRMLMDWNILLNTQYTMKVKHFNDFNNFNDINWMNHFNHFISIHRIDFV